VDGIFLGHNLLLSQAFLVGITSWMGFSRPQLVVSGLSGGNPFVDGIFLRHNLLLSQASFFMVEFRLSRGLSQELFPFS
jgi:hypothetical protein